MISWIQQTFQHHFRTIFAILLALIIISFVFVTNASSGLGRSTHKIASRPFFGIDLSVKEDRERLERDTNLSLRFGLFPQNIQFANSMEQYALTRHAQIAMADRLHVPAPTTAELKDSIQTVRMFAGPDGKFDVKLYEDYRKELRKGGRETEADVTRVLSDDIRADRVRKLVSGPGYVTPYDVKKELERADTSWTVAVATIDRQSFAPAIAPTDADLKKYFDENAFRYEIPARVTVRYAEFPATSFIGAVNVSEAEVRAYYDANPARFPKPATTAPDPKNPAVPPAAANPDADYPFVRPQVELALRLEKANRLAGQAASKFSLAVYEGKLALDSPGLASLLVENRIALKDVPAFAAENVPPQLGRNPQIAEEAFKLSKTHLSSDPIGTESGAVVLFWNGSDAPRQPDFAEVRAKVSADYIDNEKRNRFVELGKTLRSQIELRLKAGESFEKAATGASTAAGVKTEVKTLPAFTLRQPPQNLERDALVALDKLKQGEVSDMNVAETKGTLFFAQEKKLPELSDSNPQFVATRARIAQSSALFSGIEHFNHLVAQEQAKWAATAQ